MAFTLRQSVFRKLLDEGALKSGRVLDLGGGKGVDAFNLVESGFTVDVVDSDLEHIKNIQSKNNTKITTFHTKIEDFQIQKDTYNLIIASFSLQFLTKEKAQQVIARIVEGATYEGIIFLNVIGDRDEWVKSDKWSYWKKDEIVDFLKTFPVKIRNCKEEEGMGDSKAGVLKYWHVIEFVLLKN